jgi:two-component system, chemotaxis family, sensor kinase CheA
MPMLTDDEINAQVLAAFQEEQFERRQAIGELLLELERSPAHPRRQALLDQLFREAHSLKGGARAAGQPAVEQVAHLVEDLFSAVRQNRLALASDICDPIYAALDVIGVLMHHVAVGQLADLAPYQPLLAALGQIRDAHVALPALTYRPELDSLSAISAAPLPPSAVDVATLAGNEHVAAELPPFAPGPEEQAVVRLSTTLLDQLLNETGELLTCAVTARVRARDMRALAELPSRWRRTWRQIQPALGRFQSRAPTLQPIVHYGADVSIPIEAHPASITPSHLDSDATRLLDALSQAHTLIGDLESRLATHARQTTEEYTRLNAATERLHDQIRRTRMLPLNTLFTPLRLQMREMARATQKQVALVLDDGGAEADRQVLERLRDVLLHLLRNAIDHGIEPPAARVAVGKPPEGRIALRAEVSGEYLTLTLEDDGAGLDLERIGRRALSGGLLSAAELARASAADLVELIFVTGFTTRTEVGTLSGRGVGLDIVRAHVERMHGRVTVQTNAGTGCIFTVTVPLSLTASNSLLVRAGAITYALPLDSVQRIVIAGPGDSQILAGRAVLVIDGRPLPLLHLCDVLGARQSAERTSAGALALLLGSGERQAACMVDAVLGEQELMLQRLPAPIQQLRLIAGATILADGSVVPILDATDLLRAALGARPALVAGPLEVASQPIRTVLVADDSLTTRTLEKNILEAAGYRVRLATDGLEALHLLDQLAEEGGCDLLLSDVDMPRLNGFDLTSAVRADPRFRHLPVVLVTSLDTPADRERGIAAGADSYIVKRMFDQQTLIETIAQLV